jgi:hypothetical protein
MDTSRIVKKAFFANQAKMLGIFGVEHLFNEGICEVGDVHWIIGLLAL